MGTLVPGLSRHPRMDMPRVQLTAFRVPDAVYLSRDTNQLQTLGRGVWCRLAILGTLAILVV